MKICPNCQLANDDRNYQCPRCGGFFYQYYPSKPKRTNIFVTICVAAILIIFALWFIGELFNVLENNSKKEIDDVIENAPSKEYIIKNATPFNYKSIKRNPEKHYGEYYIVNIKIFTVFSEKSENEGVNYYNGMVDIDNDGKFDIEIIYLLDYRKDGENIIEDDILRAYIKLEEGKTELNFQDKDKYVMYYADILTLDE